MGIEVPRKFFNDVVGSVRQAVHAVWNWLVNCTWILKKKLQSVRHTHLSHILAIILLILVMVREWPELTGMLFGYSLPTFFGFLILVIVTLTYLTARWELFGDKLTTSPQELRFHWGSKRALRRLEALKFELRSTIDFQPVFDSFVTELVEITAGTFSTKYFVDAGIMIKDPNEESLVLTYWSSGAEYPVGLRIPIPVARDHSNTGPAGVAFADQVLVYVPNKKSKRGWPFVSLDELELSGIPEPRYELGYPVVCWINSLLNNSIFRAFRSEVLRFC
jgi:hypothetical protein